MNTKQLNRIFARAMYGIVIVTMVFSAGAVAYAAPESVKLQTDGPPELAWLQANADGFGDSQNQQIPSLAVFGGYLYAGTWNAVWEEDNVAFATAQIWRTPDGAKWEMVNETEANGAAALIVYKGYLYSGSWNNDEWDWGGKIWRSKDGVNWDPVDGFTSGNGIARFAVFKNALYASTWGDGTEIWRTTNGVDWKLFAAPGWDYENNGGAISSEVFNGFLYWGVPNWTTGAQIWRTDGVSMVPVTTDGFGSTDNSAVPSLAAFNDNLYAGVWNSQGVQVWRSINGTDWEQVSEVGSLSTGNTNNALEVYDGQLYLVVQNDSTGLEVWRTANGIDWEQVGFAGFGDGNNQWSYWDNATTVFKGNLFVATNNFASGGEVWEFCPTGCENVPVGDRISVFNGGEMEFPAETPFHIMHGFLMSSDDSAFGVYDFELEVDDIPQREDFKMFWVEDGDLGKLQRRWVYNFPDGMTGFHKFTGHWFEPCQYATSYTDPCPSPNAKVETRTQTLYVNFVFPPLNLRVNYGDDWVESFYEAGHEVLITVTDGDGNVKATATEWTEPKDFWGWEEGFQTGWSDWIDSGGNSLDAPPDILPGDWVYGEVDNGVGVQVQIGEITGVINLDGDSVEGTVLAPWFANDVEVDVECHPWGSPEPVDMKYDSALPDGEDSYSCSWSGEWDIQPGQVVGVGYSSPDGHWVANVFVVTNPTFVAYLPWTIVGYDWPIGDTIDISINNDEYVAQAQVGNADWDPTVVLFELWRDDFTMEAGDHIVMADESTGITKEVWVTNLAVTDFDLNTKQVFGTYDPAYDLQVWLYDLEEQIPETDPDNGTWFATFTELPPGAWGGATQWDEDGDGTSIDFRVPAPRFTVFPELESLELWEWPIGADVHISVEDPATDESPDYEDDYSVGIADWDPAQSYLWISIDGLYNIKPDDIVTITDNVTTRTHTVQNLSITVVDKEVDTVSGTADVGALVYTWVHEYGYDMELAVEDGTWLADFGSAGLDLVESMGGRAEIRDEIGNATAVDWWIPNPHFSVFPEWEYIEGWQWPDGALVTAEVDGKPECYAEEYSGHPDWDPNELFVSFWFPEGCDIAVGDLVTLTDGTTTRTHAVQNLSITSVDMEANTVSGTADTGAEVHVWAHGYDELLPTTSEDGIWFADFSSIGIDLIEGMGGRTEIRDEFGNATAVDWRILNPYIEASSYSNWVHAREWPIGTVITLTISGSSETYTATMAQAPWNPDDPNDIVADFDLQGYEVKVGDVLTATGNNTTKILTVSQLEITDYDLEADTISGVGTADAQIQVCANVQDHCITRWVTADANGNWIANYALPGTGNDDPDTFDVQPGSNGWAAEYETDSDRTWYDWWILNPRFTVFPEWEWFDGNDWPDGATVTITVEGKSECATGGVSSGNFFNGGFPEGCDIVAGDVVTFTDGETTRIHTIQNLAITAVDKEANTVSGIANVGVVVYAWVHEYGYDMQLQVEDGTWLADFGSAGLDLMENMGGRAEVRDEFGNGTAVDWWIPEPPPSSRTLESGNFYVEWSTTNPEEVTYLSWKGSPNLASSCTPPNCPGNFEFFGNSWVSDNEGTPDFFFASLVGGGSTGSWAQAGTTVDIHSICLGCWNSADTPIHTAYQFFDDPSKADLIAITRTFEFGETLFAHAIRVFIPRLYPFDGFTQVVYPDVGGNLVVTEAICDFGCQATGWDGSWFAIHNPATGQGVILQRVPSTIAPALWLDWDAASFTNASNFLLLPPEGGFTDTVTETEYLCFYDSYTWTPSLTLPEGCQP